MAAPVILEDISPAESQIRFLRHILRFYAEGCADEGQLARFALDSPADAMQAYETYLAQQRAVSDAAETFCADACKDSAALERESDCLIRLRGSRSKAPIRRVRR